MDSLNLVIPVYNEKDNILKTFKEIEKKVKQKKIHIYIVYDFAEDNTLPVINRYLEEHNIFEIELIKNKYGRGVLNAIKTGIESVDSGPIVVVMADLSDDLESVNSMIALYNKGYNVICGSRYMTGGKQFGGPFYKSFLSRMAGVSLYYLIQIPTHDVTNSFKLYDKAIFKDIVIRSKGGFELGMEITIKGFIKGYKIGEVPTIWHDRVDGSSNFRFWQWLPSYMKWYLYALLYGNPLIRLLRKL